MAATDGLPLPQVGLSLTCSKIYLLFLPELLKIPTYYSYFISKHHQLLFYCVNDITMQDWLYVYNLHSF